LRTATNYRKVWRKEVQGSIDHAVERLNIAIQNAA
jgi:hypothetical protein